MMKMGNENTSERLPSILKHKHSLLPKPSLPKCSLILKCHLEELNKPVRKSTSVGTDAYIMRTGSHFQIMLDA